MIQIDKTDFLYKTLLKLGVSEQDLDDEYISFASKGISNAKDFNNNLNAELGLDYLGEFDDNVFEEVLPYYQDLKRNKQPKNKFNQLLVEYKQTPTQELKTNLVHAKLNDVLLIACAYKLRHIDLNLNDVVQVCNIGLLTAIDKYSVEAKLSFETYLNYWILKAVTNEFTLGGENNGK